MVTRPSVAGSFVLTFARAILCCGTDRSRHFAVFRPGNHPVAFTIASCDVTRFLKMVDEAQICVWIDGGWGVDALLQAESRSHRDLDIIIDANDASRLKAVSSHNGYQTRQDPSGNNFILTDNGGNEIDVHVVSFDARGFGVFGLPDGRVWPLPPSAFAGRGSIARRTVRCLSPEAQVLCHAQGYEPTAKDIDDMQRLQERFGVALPLSLCRQ